jgi:type II secretion system protein G
MKVAPILNRRSGFTLIELLIVVAIIAILAAIAVPNFLEAQTRSKVSRTLADVRSIRVGLESYYVDNNKYPETDEGVNQIALGRRSIYRITTPIAYMSSIPKSPWKEKFGFNPSFGEKSATMETHVLYVRKIGTFNNGLDTIANYDASYLDDRRAYLMLSLTQVDKIRGGYWLMKSVGPDNIDDRGSAAPGLGANARIYDPTNGTVSRGDIVVFTDVGGSLK